ncbi:SDR family NAD(P)-dependent oxidoreductase [Kocuria sp. M1R5S2]|uniref:SDR family NAD(P)-dependent oxidoreductase n=1 Tax=Kocuria rhizosphaerae TaxID=3376285 RepID=UPI0037B95947
MRQRVLVTGGSSGIGAAIARRSASEGHEVEIIDLVGPDAVHADLSSVEQTAAALDEVLRRGPVTRLVNNVGYIRPAPVSELDLEDWDRTVQINLRSAVQCVQAVLPGMREEGFGRMVNISSRAALGKEGRAAYGSAKAGLIGLTRTLALELAADGITVNAVAPGPIRTALFDQANPPGAARTRAIIDSIPVRRVGEPEDVAHAAAYFLDERSGFVTGQTLYVCGGKTVGLAPI